MALYTGPGVSAGFSFGTQFVNNIVVAKEKGIAFLSRDSQPLPTAFESNDILSPNGSAYLGSPNPTGLNGNISADPLFVNSSAGEYHLRHGSPCIDAGNNAVGERVVLVTFDRTKTDKEMVAILWTLKTDILVIESQSMAHALAFEKSYCR